MEYVQDHIDSEKVSHAFATYLNLECAREGSEVRPDFEQTMTGQAGDNSALVSTHLHITPHYNCQDSGSHART